VVTNDEQGAAGFGTPPDPGYRGFSGLARDGKLEYSLHDIRKATLWGNLMAGGAGVEYYFGYKLPQNDLICEDYRSRDQSWDYGRIALTFFAENDVPFWEMTCADHLVGNDGNDNSCYGFAKAGELYLVYLPDGGTGQLDLAGAQGKFTVQWFDPRRGGSLQNGSVPSIQGGKNVSLGAAPGDQQEDWLVVVRKQ
jgi:hypothetical protein